MIIRARFFQKELALIDVNPSPPLYDPIRAKPFSTLRALGLVRATTMYPLEDFCIRCHPCFSYISLSNYICCNLHALLIYIPKHKFAALTKNLIYEHHQYNKSIMHFIILVTYMQPLQSNSRGVTKENH